MEQTDISPINVAFTCDQAFTDDNSLAGTLGREKPATANHIGGELPQTPHLPKQIVRSATWGMWYDYPSESIRIIDWGAAFPIDERPTKISQPPSLRSPETFL